MKKHKILILPDCTDLNRGDQALVWETIRLAKDSGFDGDFFIQSEPILSKQSIKKGFKCFSPILKHPSRNKKTNNIQYGLVTKVKWGVQAIIDLAFSLSLLAIAKSEKLCRIFSKETRSEIDKFRDADAVFIKGGGFIHSYGGITVPYYLYFHLFPIYLAKRLGKPVFVMPNSFGPLDGFTAKWQVRKALKGCELVLCRESISHAYMTMHFPDIEFKLTDDLGFYLQPSDVDISMAETQRPAVAITTRPYRFPEHKNGEELYETYLGSFRKLARHIFSKGFMPVFVQHTLAINSHEDDLKSIQAITSGLPDGEYQVIVNSSYDCSELKHLYSQFKYIVGTRFHSVIFSIASGVPAVSVAYGGNKSRGIMRDNGLEDYVVDIDDLCGDKLCEAFDRMVANDAVYRTKLAELKTRIAKNRRKIVSDLRNYVK